MLPCVIGVPDTANVYETGSPIRIRLRYLLRVFKIRQVTHCRVRCTHPPHSQRNTSGLAILGPMPMPDQGVIALGPVAGVTDLRENMRQVRSADWAR